MFGCSKKHVYLLRTSDVTKQIESLINEELYRKFEVTHRLLTVKIVDTKRLPKLCWYIKIPTKYLYRLGKDLEFDWEYLSEVFSDYGLIELISSSIHNNRLFWNTRCIRIHLISAKHRKHNYLIFYWR